MVSLGGSNDMSADGKTSMVHLWRFGALELGESMALGGDVRLELDPRTTVLVGRNGAGQSAIFDKIRAGHRGAIMGRAGPVLGHEVRELHLPRSHGPHASRERVHRRCHAPARAILIGSRRPSGSRRRS